MTLRAATLLSALVLAAPLAATSAQAAPCHVWGPYGCEIGPREVRAPRVAYVEAGWRGPAAWRGWEPVVEPRAFTRFDIEGIRLLQRMP
ncbi:hypothetical protein [Methylobacterium oryzisoli]|uniref:hypothetical protein n=1 Tax=Methylobacterium oryzisoli TaxID=3385502 RepID=UPI003892536F